jgi:5-methyltetrahydropteroyltriglutamate--homocysteine methyltransferase
VALEKYWKKNATLAELLSVRDAVQAAAWGDQKAAGIALIAADGTLYDQLLDTTFMLGVIPKRFKVRVSAMGGGYGRLARRAGAHCI